MGDSNELKIFYFIDKDLCFLNCTAAMSADEAREKMVNGDKLIVDLSEEEKVIFSQKLKNTLEERERRMFEAWEEAESKDDLRDDDYFESMSDEGFEDDEFDEEEECFDDDGEFEDEEEEF